MAKKPGKTPTSEEEERNAAGEEEVVEEQPEQIRVLVVGDWVVDEHWVTGIHRSPTSSRTGPQHNRSLHAPSSTVESLCGAGRTASVLHQVKVKQDEEDEGTHPFDIYGIGLWHPSDTPLLEGMLDPTNHIGETPFRLTRTVNGATQRSHLFNLADLLPAEDRENAFGTTHIIRSYQSIGSAVRLIQRTDWERPVQPDSDQWIESDEPLQNAASAWTSFPTNIDALVVKDLCKGVVSGHLLDWLKNRFPNTPWFISTKAWKPDWFGMDKSQWTSLLSDIDLRLLIVPQVAAESAIRAGSVHRWITSSGAATHEALEGLNSLFKALGGSATKPHVVVLPNEMQVLGRGKGEEDDVLGYVHSELKDPEPVTVGIPMASVFYAAGIAQLLLQEQTELEDLIRTSLNFTHVWRKEESNRVRDPDTWSPSSEGFCVPWRNKEKEMISIAEFPWQEAKQEWEQALTDMGIVERGGSWALELWRGMTLLEGFVCLTPHKREEITKLMKGLARFRQNQPKKHESCLLVASPGSGKTHLVRKIAEQFDVRFLAFNITQMLSRGDILDCFDTIVTTQAQDRGKSILVFVDEINAKLDNQHVYDAFLAPLEEGVYVRGGKQFSIDPCIWVFAGTASSEKSGEEDRDPADKTSDFESRLTLGSFDLFTLRDEEAIEKLERVYIGAGLLSQAFPDVRKVSEKVLLAFKVLPQGTSLRDIRHFVDGFTDIQYGLAKSGNVPKLWLKELFEELERPSEYVNWKESDEGQFVEIK